MSNIETLIRNIVINLNKGCENNLIETPFTIDTRGFGLRVYFMGHGVEERLVWDLWGINSANSQDENLIAEDILRKTSRVLRRIEFDIRSLYKEYNIPYEDLKSE